LSILFIAALAAFLSRQPTTLLVKVLSKRRPRKDLMPALFWMLVYALVAGAAVALLVRMGHPRLLLLAAPGIPVFAWHLWLVSRREERGQRGIELVASGVLALTAPGAYWLSGGDATLEALALWLMTWMQSAASIVLVYLRLHYRQMKDAPPCLSRLKRGARTLAYHLFNLVVSSILFYAGLVPAGAALAFGLMLLDALDGVFRPPVGVKPTSIGLRQLAFSIAFVVIVSSTYLFSNMA
jgi:hypothetical protein